MKMYNTYARPVRDLRNNYAEIASLANAGNRVIITNNGREEVIILGKEEYKSYEELLYREYIKKELAETREKAKDPNTNWLSEEEFWAGLEE